MKRVAFATCGQLPSIKSDEQPVATQLEERGIRVEPVVWDSQDVIWEDFDAIVIRTCWDYHLRSAEFLHWISATVQKGVRVWNPPSILSWNAQKSYLRELEARGIQTIPTEWVTRGSTASLEQILLSKHWPEAVVKPVISASAYQTWKTSLATAVSDQPRLDQMLAQSDVMVQPFMAEICAQGEWSLIFFQGQYSHAVVKTPQPGDFRVQPDYGGSFRGEQPPAWLVEQASQIMAMMGSQLLYGRVDGLDVNGTLMLMELELLEPNLFLAAHDQASHRFAEAIQSFIV